MSSIGERSECEVPPIVYERARRLAAGYFSLVRRNYCRSGASKPIGRHQRIVMSRDGPHITASLAANRGTAGLGKVMLASGDSEVCRRLLPSSTPAVSGELDERST